MNWNEYYYEKAVSRLEEIKRRQALDSMDLVDYIGQPALLEQTAEEATELAFACLKLARMLRCENKAHGRTYEELVDNLHEEFADIFVCQNELSKAYLVSSDTIGRIYEEKKQRMKKRLEEENNGRNKGLDGNKLDRNGTHVSSR